MAKSSQTVRLLCMREVSQITSQACDNFLKNYRKHFENPIEDLPQDDEIGPISWHTNASEIRSEIVETDGSKAEVQVDECNGDMCCPKKRKKKSCPKRNPCAKKPACPKKRKKRPCCPKKRKPACRKKPACPRKRQGGCPKRRVKCSKPGPVMNNGYLNFVRSFRRKHCGLKPQELIQKAARAWCSLPEEKKDRYRRMACKVTTSVRHKHRRVCTGK